jgi:RNA polymerase sigma-70 factor (sigma-E family)
VGHTFAATAGPGAVGRPAERGDDAAQSFDAFARAQIPGLSRLGWMLTGDHASAEDLTAETLMAAWNGWERILEVDNPVAYLRRIMVNLAAARVRSSVRERRRIRLYHADARGVGVDPDGGTVVDVRAALRLLPAGRRACVVLRHAFDLSEDEVARTLRISVGTVKSQTSKGMAQLHRILAGGDVDA